jgi:hypothetical protein
MAVTFAFLQQRSRMSKEEAAVQMPADIPVAASQQGSDCGAVPNDLHDWKE